MPKVFSADELQTLKELKQWRAYYKKQIATAKAYREQYESILSEAEQLSDKLLIKAKKQETESKKEKEKIDAAMISQDLSTLINYAGIAGQVFDIATDAIVDGNLNVPKVVQTWIKKFAEGKKSTLIDKTINSPMAVLAPGIPVLLFGVSGKAKIVSDFIAAVDDRKLDVSGVVNATVTGTVKYRYGLLLLPQLTALLIAWGKDPNFFSVDLEASATLTGKAVLGKFSLDYLPTDPKTVTTSLTGTLSPLSIATHLQGSMAIRPNKDFTKTVNELRTSYDNFRKSTSPVISLPQFPELKDIEIELGPKIPLFTIEMPLYSLRYHEIADGSFKWDFVTTGEFKIEPASYQDICNAVQEQYLVFLGTLDAIATMYPSLEAPIAVVKAASNVMAEVAVDTVNFIQEDIAYLREIDNDLGVTEVLGMMVLDPLKAVAGNVVEHVIISGLQDAKPYAAVATHLTVSLANLGAKGALNLINNSTYLLKGTVNVIRNPVSAVSGILSAGLGCFAAYQGDSSIEITVPTVIADLSGYNSDEPMFNFGTFNADFSNPMDYSAFDLTSVDIDANLTGAVDEVPIAIEDEEVPPTEEDLDVDAEENEGDDEPLIE